MIKHSVFKCRRCYCSELEVVHIRTSKFKVDRITQFDDHMPLLKTEDIKDSEKWRFVCNACKHIVIEADGAWNEAYITVINYLNTHGELIEK